MIDDSFKGLKSAEAAYDLIQNLKNVRTRKGIKDHMN